MISYNRTADPHSLDVKRDGSLIGMAQWHPGRSPRFIPWALNGDIRQVFLTIEEMRTIADKLEECKKAGRAIE